MSIFYLSRIGDWLSSKNQTINSFNIFGLKKLSLFCIFLLLSACSMDAAITDLSNVSDFLDFKVKGKEIVPVSNQESVTAAGFRVQSSVSYLKAPAEVITPAGFKVRTSVQSLIYREER